MALLQKQIISCQESRVEVQHGDIGISMLYLMGGTGKEKNEYSKCVMQFFAEIDNQRYLLVKKKKRKGLDGFFAVPDCFASKKEDATLFLECMKKYLGDYELIYTRNEKGRRLKVHWSSQNESHLVLSGIVTPSGAANSVALFDTNSFPLFIPVTSCTVLTLELYT